MNDDIMEDPFAGIETIGKLSPYPSAEFMDATEPTERPANSNLIRGLKKQTVLAFVKYLKTEMPGEVDPNLEVTLRPITFGELERLGERFLER